MHTSETLAFSPPERLLQSGAGNARLRTLLAATLVGALMLPGPAGAGSNVFGNVTFGEFGAFSTGVTVQAYAYTNGATPLSFPDEGIFAGTRLPTLNQDPPAKLAQFDDPFLGDAQVTATYTGNVANGVIHETSSGTATGTAGSAGALAFPASASVSGEIGWFDTITVHGPAKLDVLLVGLHEDVQKMTASGKLSGSDITETLQIFDITQSGDPAKGQLVFDLSHCLQTGVPPNRCPTKQGPTMAAITVHPGQQFVVVDKLDFDGQSPISGNVLKGNFVLNLADSAYFTIDPQTAGEVVTTGTGINYASAVFPPHSSSGVPEPPALALLVMSLGGLALVRVRGRHNRLCKQR